MPSFLPSIPETVTVHLGSPSSNAQNVTTDFASYIKNVASSEIYPTWDEEALRANILAQISFALNRIYTQYYRNRGYSFDITNDTSIDQAYVYGRDIFENVSRIVDEIFNSYIRRTGTVEPLYALYCDGVRVSCGGLSQWGAQSLAQQGLSAMEILRRYYGDDIELVTDVPVGGSGVPAPRVPLRSGSSGPAVQLLQIRLNRISQDYPAIPKIYPTNGVFGPDTERAVKAFQQTFNLSDDGIVGNATWYRVSAIYNAVKRLNELTSEGLGVEEVSTRYPISLGPGSEGSNVRILQYYLNYVAQFLDAVPPVSIDGSYGPATERAVRAFQQAYGLTADGIVGEATWDALYRAYLGFVAEIPLIYREGVVLPFPGTILTVGSEGEAVRLLQSYLNYIARTYTDIPTVNVTGYYGAATSAAVEAFVREFGLSLPDTSVNSALWQAIGDVYQDLYFGNRASEGQYPGYTVN